MPALHSQFAFMEIKKSPGWTQHVASPSQIQTKSSHRGCIDPPPTKGNFTNLPSGLGRALLFLEMQICSWVARCSHLLCLKAISKSFSSWRTIWSFLPGQVLGSPQREAFLHPLSQESAKCRLKSDWTCAYVNAGCSQMPLGWDQTQAESVALGCKCPLGGMTPTSPPVEIPWHPPTLPEMNGFNTS